MKAIVQNGYGSPDVLELRDIETPPVGDDAVLVRVCAASLNAADWHLLGRTPHLIGRLLRVRPSRVRGGDLAGIVEAAGKTVTRFGPGDEVFGVGRGSLAELALATEDRLAPKPTNLTFAEAAALPIAGCTALQGLRDHGRLRPGERVVIYGAGGGVGTLAVQIAKALGARVTAVTAKENLDLLRSLGADAVVDYAAEDFTRREERYDVLFDLGADRPFAECRRVLGPGGRFVLCGAPKGLGAQLSLVIRTMRQPVGGDPRVAFLARVRHEDLLVLRGWVEEGKLSPVIDREYSLSEVPGAMRYLGTRRARGKIVVRVS